MKFAAGSRAENARKAECFVRLLLFSRIFHPRRSFVLGFITADTEQHA